MGALLSFGISYLLERKILEVSFYPIRLKGIGNIKPINMVIEMADNTKSFPKGIVKNLLIKIDKFIFPVDFVILDMIGDFRMPIILGRPLLATAHAKLGARTWVRHRADIDERTPIDTEKKLGPEGSPVTDPTLYRSLAGSLQYLTFTRPDLSYAVQQLCLYMHDPREPHLNAMKRVLRYLRGTTDLGLQLFWSTTSQLIAYFDADWAGCPATRRSTSGYCVFLAETSWIRNLLREFCNPLFTATLVYCDNVSVVYMSANPVQHQRTKHIEIDIHFVRDKVATCHVRVLHVPSRFRYADIFPKGLPYPLFADFRSSLSVRKSPAPTAGAY
ncbi:ribonuclease H-like domain-containing protein [Tanacetum coccineum]